MTSPRSTDKTKQKHMAAAYLRACTIHKEGIHIKSFVKRAGLRNKSLYTVTEVFIKAYRKIQVREL